MASKFNLEKTIQRRAERALARLLKRGDANDYNQARKFAAAAKSWCQMNPEIGAKSGQLHSRRRGGATWRMWDVVISMCEAGAVPRCTAAAEIAG